MAKKGASRSSAPGATGEGPLDGMGRILRASFATSCLEKAVQQWDLRGGNRESVMRRPCSVSVPPVRSVDEALRVLLVDELAAYWELCNDRGRRKAG